MLANTNHMPLDGLRLAAVDQLATTVFEVDLRKLFEGQGLEFRSSTERSGPAQQLVGSLGPIKISLVHRITIAQGVRGLGVVGGHEQDRLQVIDRFVEQVTAQKRLRLNAAASNLIKFLFSRQMEKRSFARCGVGAMKPVYVGQRLTLERLNLELRPVSGRYDLLVRHQTFANWSTLRGELRAPIRAAGTQNRIDRQLRIVRA